MEIGKWNNYPDEFHQSAKFLNIYISSRDIVDFMSMVVERE